MLPGRGGGLWKLVVQGVGFLLGIGLLVWCVRSAFADEQHRRELARLLEAPPLSVAGMLGLSAATILLDGLMFRSVLSPVYVVSRWRIMGVSGVCSALGYLPFKMSLVFRVVYHSRRDGLPILTIGAWVAATGVLLLCSLLPPLGVLVVRPVLDSVWWGLTVGGSLGSAVLAHLLARWLLARQEAGTLTALADATRLRAVGRFARSDGFARLMTGVRMLADPGACAGGFGFRVAIVACQAARFMLAGSVLGIAVDPAQALLVGASYNLIQAISPGGVGGFREAGASGVLAVLKGPDILAVVLAVSATEAVMNLTLGLIGGFGLRVDRLLWTRRGEAGERA